MRVFLAIEPDAATLDLLRAEIERLRKLPWGRHVRWVRADQLHLTLRFLGDISAAQTQRYAALIAAGLAAEPAAPLTLRLASPRPFPKPAHPRVIARLAQANTGLDALAELAERSAQAIGVAAERRRFNGHITLGRTQPSFPSHVSLPETPGCDMRARAVVLFESTLTPSGPIYAQLAEYVRP